LILINKDLCCYVLSVHRARLRKDNGATTSVKTQVASIIVLLGLGCNLHCGDTMNTVC